MIRLLLPALALATLASGCISVLPKPPKPPRIFVLRAGPVAPAATVKTLIVVAVSAPSAPRGAAGADIVWRNGGEVAFMGGSAWDGTAPELLQAMLTEILDQRGGVRAAAPTGAGVRADAEIRWMIRAFEVVEEAGKLDAVLDADVMLIDTATRRIAADRRFRRSAPIASRSASFSAAALETAARAVATEIAAWAETEVQPIAASISK
jgi:cholesterol transport system auxiliary component